MIPTRALGLVLLTLAAAAPAPAQDAQFGIPGLGTVGHWESVRARSTGGAFAAFDAASPLTDAALGLLERLTAYGAATASFRSVSAAGEDASLRETRFPTVVVAGPIGPVVIGGGYGTYLLRNYRLVRSDTVVLRGQPEAFTDDLASEGGVGDVRFAAALRAGSILRLGASLHFLTGVARQTAVRRFADSATYESTEQVDDIRMTGLAAAASLLLSPGGGLQLAAWARADGRLEYDSPDSSGAYDLPLSAGAALKWAPDPRVALAASVDWRGWSVAMPNSFDVVTWSVGAELGDPRRPVRIGVRRGELPFGPGSEPPTELGVSLGIGLRFSDGRAVIDLGVERLKRSGSGLDDTAWSALFGITVRP